MVYIIICKYSTQLSDVKRWVIVPFALSAEKSRPGPISRNRPLGLGRTDPEEEGRSLVNDSDVRTAITARGSAVTRPLTDDLAIVALRLAVGVVMAYHGWLKIGEEAGFAGYLDLLGIPAPELMAYVVTYLEFLGGMALIVGVATRFVAALFVVEMIFTIALVKVDVGLIAAEGVGAELDLLILAIALALVLTGAGRWSVDAVLTRRRST